LKIIVWKTEPEIGELSLFWKKKKTFDVELDARHDDNRAAYRIAPERSRPVIISIMGVVRVLRFDRIISRLERKQRRPFDCPAKILFFQLF
jgi:hypothetical protein